MTGGIFTLDKHLRCNCFKERWKGLKLLQVHGIRCCRNVAAELCFPRVIFIIHAGPKLFEYFEVLHNDNISLTPFIRIDIGNGPV